MHTAFNFPIHLKKFCYKLYKLLSEKFSICQVTLEKISG